MEIDDRPWDDNSEEVAWLASGASYVYLVAWVGLTTIETTVDLAIWSGIAMLFLLGYVAGRLRATRSSRLWLTGSCSRSSASRAAVKYVI